MARPEFKWIAARFGLLLLLAVVTVIVYQVFFAARRPPQRAMQPTGAEALRMIELKHEGLGLLENLPNDATDDGSRSAEIFTELDERLPGERLGPRNLAVARILIFSKTDHNQNREAAALALQEAEVAIAKLQDIGDAPAIVHLLAANLAKQAVEKQFAADERRVVEELSEAARLRPDDSLIWGELFLSARASADDEIRAHAAEALERAFALDPRNLVLLTERLLFQARAKDPTIVETLTAAESTLRPYAAALEQRGLDLMRTLEEAIAAAEAGGEADWQIVLSKVAPLVNVLRPELAYQHDLRRLERFVLEYVLHDFSPEFYAKADLPESEPPPRIDVKLAKAAEQLQLPERPDVRHAVLADFDLDGRLDVIVLTEDRVEVYGRRAEAPRWELLAEAALPAEMTHVLAIDLDSDYQEQPVLQAPCQKADVDLIVYGPGGVRLLKNTRDKETGRRSLEIMPQTAEFEALNDVLAVAAADLDHDGDLDLVISTDVGISLWSNREDFVFADISARSALPPAGFQATAVVPVDWDRNVAIDLLLAGPGMRQVGRLENILHGRFRWQEFAAEFGLVEGAVELAIADADGNASWDLLAAGPNGITLTQTETPEPGVVRPVQTTTITQRPATGIKLWDFDNDGLQDLLAFGPEGLVVYRSTPNAAFEPAADLIAEPPRDVTACDVGDLDGDGDLDLLVLADGRPTWYVNEGGNQNHWIDITLSAETEPKLPAQRSNLYGVGSLVELKAGTSYQAQVVTRQTTHFGLGQRERPDVVRVLWTNGIPQNVLNPERNAAICQEQRLLKGSCPYLYTWTGSKYEFFTDLLWSAPIGLQFAEGVLAPSREWEYLKIPGERLAAIDGEYRLQITEELWEAGYFDTVQLLAVDHPAGVEIFSNEKVGPAEIAAFKVHTVRNRRTPVAAQDQRGRDVLKTIAHEDDVYLRAFESRRKQGLTEEHFLELDLGPLDSPQRITLFLTGWVFPTDTSLNVAISQIPQREPTNVAEFPRIRAERATNPADAAGIQAAGPAPESLGIRLRPPSVWVPDADGQWREVIPYMGFPGGKTKTIAVDLSRAFLPNDYRLRIATTMEICWDAAFFTVDEEPAPTKVTQLPLLSADLHYRGFSRRVEHPQFGPESYDYASVSTGPRWPPMAGRFTRYGDVTELLAEADDRLVVLGAGDEMTLRFQATVDGPPDGWKRDFLIYNVGWDKDADLNTVYGQTVEPLPFRAMSGYPYPESEKYPETPQHQNYLRKYQTRTQNPQDFWKQLRRR